MKNILAFGDSNTWGLIAGTKERYPWGTRWTSVLQEQCDDARIIEEGLCGRTTIFEDELRNGRRGLGSLPMILESHAPLDGVILMLGTNDCKTYYNAPAHVIGEGVSLCIDEIKKFVPEDKILLVSPILLGEDVWHPDKDPEFDQVSVNRCKQLPGVYEGVAKTQGTAYLAASDYAVASSVDEEHMTAESHGAFAGVVYEKLREMQIL